ncbi:MAG: hypothetical protein QGF46_03720 [Planctomycetota bacterium]|jgi:hypothetical protein|nr:hypothetical protein [Planctomycetota bacterium]
MQPSCLTEIQPCDLPDFFVPAKGMLYFELSGDVTDTESEFTEGDILSVNPDFDAEPGDTVVWWTGVERTLALARIDENMSFHGLAGFAPPVAEQPAKIRGVVSGVFHPIA